VAPNAQSVTTLNFDGVDALSWRYINVGDYNQDGLVGIADLTPLGQFFGESTAPNPFPFESNLSAIDGDGNGNLNISDITPIGANFGRSANGGWNIYESTDAGDLPANNGGANGPGAALTANVAHSEATAIRRRTAGSSSTRWPRRPPMRSTGCAPVTAARTARPATRSAAPWPTCRCCR
jgi:hypothetical protein